jgi:hypothetical protein
MAFPGMSAPGLSGDAGMDEQKLKEQQMIKFVRPLPILEQTSSETDISLDATSYGVMSSKDCHVGCHGFWFGWSFWSLHVECESSVLPRLGKAQYTC